MKKENIVLFAGIASLIFGVVFFAYRSEMGPFASNTTRYRHALSTTRDHEKQIEFLEDRLKKDPSSALNHAALAQIYVSQARRTGDVTWYDKAEALAKKSLSLLSFGNLGARLVLAQVAESRHEFPQAIALAQDCLKQKPFDEGAYRIIITSSLATGDNATAARAAEELTQRRPFLSTYTMRALVMVAQGRDEEALFDFRRALKVEDVGETLESARTRALMARFLMGRGRMKEAKSALDEALRIVPDYHFTLAMLGQYQIKKGNYKEAQDALMKAFTSSKQLPYLVWYGKAKAMGGDQDGALEALDTAEKLLRADLATHPYGHRLELAKLLLFRNGPKDGLEAVKLAAEEAKVRENTDIFTLATALMTSGHLEHAKDAIQMVLAIGAKEAEYFETAAAIELKTGDKGRARFYDELARQINPNATENRQTSIAHQILEKKKASL